MHGVHRRASQLWLFTWRRKNKKSLKLNGRAFRALHRKQTVHGAKNVLFYSRFHFLCKTEARALIGPLGAWLFLPGKEKADPCEGKRCSEQLCRQVARRSRVRIPGEAPVWSLCSPGVCLWAFLRSEDIQVRLGYLGSLIVLKVRLTGGQSRVHSCFQPNVCWERLQPPVHH